MARKTITVERSFEAVDAEDAHKQAVEWLRSLKWSEFGDVKTSKVTVRCGESKAEKLQN